MPIVLCIVADGLGDFLRVGNDAVQLLEKSASKPSICNTRFCRASGRQVIDVQKMTPEREPIGPCQRRFPERLCTLVDRPQQRRHLGGGGLLAGAMPGRASADKQKGESKHHRSSVLPRHFGRRPIGGQAGGRQGDPGLAVLTRADAELQQVGDFLSGEIQ